jgi:hypothetical protein
MSRTRVYLCSLALAFAVVVPSAQQAPQFRTGIHTVPVYVTAIDASGHLVTDLTQDDFVLLDNGQVQAISNFANNTQPITVVVMLDRSGSVEEHFPLIEGAAAEFVHHLTLDDAARIGSFAERIQLDPVGFTNDRDTLLEILKTELQPIGPTPLWNATNVAMTALASQSGRRVVLMFTDGMDAPLSNRPNVTFPEIRRRAEEEEIMVYGVGLVRECEAPAKTKGKPESGLGSGLLSAGNDPRPRVVPAAARRADSDSPAAAWDAGWIAVAWRPHADTDALAASARAERTTAGVWPCETGGNHLCRHQARPQSAHTRGRQWRWLF